MSPRRYLNRTARDILFSRPLRAAQSRQVARLSRPISYTLIHVSFFGTLPALVPPVTMMCPPSRLATAALRGTGSWPSVRHWFVAGSYDSTSESDVSFVVEPPTMVTFPPLMKVALCTCEVTRG